MCATRVVTMAFLFGTVDTTPRKQVEFEADSVENAVRLAELALPDNERLSGPIEVKVEIGSTEAYMQWDGKTLNLDDVSDAEGHTEFESTAASEDEIESIRRDLEAEFKQADIDWLGETPLQAAARKVIKSWEVGDLAGAVQELSAALDAELG